MERDQATRFVHDLLRLLHSKKGSDLFLTAAATFKTGCVSYSMFGC